jgi:hypothetical protein
MEWVLGTLVGGAIGLGSALIVTEYTSWRARRTRRKDVAESLLTEITSNRSPLQEGISAITEAKTKGAPRRIIGAPFKRDVYVAHTGDLALLPRDPREAVQNFYAWLADVEFVVYEGFLGGRLHPLPDPATPHDTLKTLDDWYLGRADEAVKAADKAIAELADLTS